MPPLIFEARIRQASVFWCSIIILGLFVAHWVRVLPSIGIAGLLLTAIIYATYGPRPVWHGWWWQFLAFTSVYALHVLAGLNGHSLASEAFRQDLLLELPFLALPIAFVLLPSWPARYLRWLWLLLLSCCLISAAGATAYYLQHIAQIDQLYFQSKVMPTEPDHIRFSLLISIAILAGGVLLFTQQFSKHKNWFISIAILLLFLFQHLLAVRSGLASLYVAGLCWLGWLGWRMHRWHAALATLVVAIVLTAGSFLFPTLQNKITNTLTDTEQFDTVQAANNFSVTARMYSYDAGWQVIKANPWLGVGKVNLSNKMAEQYQYMYPEISPDRYVLPHNQYMYNLAAYGVVGLIVFLIGFYYASWQGFKQNNILLILVYIIVTISFAVEYTLESHIGVLTGLFFLLLAMAPAELEVQGESSGYSTLSSGAALVAK